MPPGLTVTAVNDCGGHLDDESLLQLLAVHQLLIFCFAFQVFQLALPDDPPCHTSGVFPGHFDAAGQVGAVSGHLGVVAGHVGVVGHFGVDCQVTFKAVGHFGVVDHVVVGGLTTLLLPQVGLGAVQDGSLGAVHVVGHAAGGVLGVLLHTDAVGGPQASPSHTGENVGVYVVGKYVGI